MMARFFLFIGVLFVLIGCSQPLKQQESYACDCRNLSIETTDGAEISNLNSTIIE
jgi:hypothetical protein